MNHTTNPQTAEQLASLAVNAANALRDEKRHYEIACQENARLRAVVARIAQMADAWEQRLPEVIRTPAVVSAIRSALEPAVSPSAVVSADRATLEVVCICGHPERQHFEDVCITEITGCDCGDFLPVEEAAEEVVRLRRIVRQTAELRRVAAEEQPAETQAPPVPPAAIRRKLRRWAYAAGHIESELDGAVDRMYAAIAQDIADARPAVGERPDTQTPETDHTERLENGRTQLLEAMSAVSEDRTCCGWASDWARTLHAEGGIWETLGRAVGWPTGNYDRWVWVSWDEAAAIYAEPAS